jgi:mRNA interferase ChpB
VARIPERGDIYHIDLDPVRGREQRGRRYVFVLSPKEFNQRGLAIALPVSQGETLARSTGFASTLMGTGARTQGVIVCDQPRTLDFSRRGARFVEALPQAAVDDVLARIAVLVT